MTNKLTSKQGSRSFTEPQVRRALMLHQWLPTRKLHIGFLVVWLLGIWVLLLMTHPGWLIAFGVIYTVLVTPAMAGADVVDGTEEFSFSLPPGRGPLFLTRMGVGLGFLLLTTGFGSLAMAFDLPQYCWSLFASSGITEPNPPIDHPFLYPLAVLAPVTAFSVTFALASLAGSRGAVGLVWLGGLALAGVLTAFTIMIETALWDRPNGWITCVTLLLTAVITLLWGYRAYLDKEAVIGGGRTTAGRGGMRWFLVIIGLVLFMLFMFSLFSVKSVDSKSMELRSARDHAETVPVVRAQEANEVLEMIQDDPAPTENSSEPTED